MLPDTRVQYRRQIVERVRALAPFLTLASDPYIVTLNGRLYWLTEGYTTSSHLPYSKAYDGRERIELSDGDAARTLERLQQALRDLQPVLGRQQ